MGKKLLTKIHASLNFDCIKAMAAKKKKDTRVCFFLLFLLFLFIYFILYDTRGGGGNQ